MFQVGGIGVKYPDGGQSQRCGVRIDFPVTEEPDVISDNFIDYALAFFE